MNYPFDIEIKQAELEAQKQHRHCWHSASDKDADNHDAQCCLCFIVSVPTEQP